MAGWQDYTAKARERGSLAAEFYAVHTIPGRERDRMQDVLPRHLDYQQDLQDRQILVFAGPLSDQTGEEMSGEGLVIYKTTSMEEADRLAAADPMHAEGCRSYSIQKWLINEGHIPEALRPLDTAGR